MNSQQQPSAPWPQAPGAEHSAQPAPTWTSAHFPAPPPSPSPTGSASRLWWQVLVAVAVVVTLGIVALLVVRSGSDGSRDGDRGASDEEVGNVEEVGDDEPVDDDVPIGVEEQSEGEESPVPTDVPGEDGRGAGEAFQPDSIAVSGESVWVSDVNCGIVVQLSQRTETVISSVDVGGSASGVTVAGGSVWIGNREISEVFRVNASTGEVEASVPIPGNALGLDTGSDGRVWAVDFDGGSVHVIDPETNSVAETVGVGANPHYVDVGDDSAWVTNNLDGTVSQIDVDTLSEIARIEVGFGPLHAIESEGSVWVTQPLGGTVVRLDAESGAFSATIDVGLRAHAVAAVEGAIWVGTENGTLWRVDPETNTSEIVADAQVNSIDMDVADADLWIADTDAGTVVRFDAASGTIASTIDLREFGDCETLRNTTNVPPPEVRV